MWGNTDEIPTSLDLEQTCEALQFIPRASRLDAFERLAKSWLHTHRTELLANSKSEIFFANHKPVSIGQDAIALTAVSFLDE